MAVFGASQEIIHPSDWQNKCVNKTEQYAPFCISLSENIM